MDGWYWFNGSWRKIDCTCNSRLHDVAQFWAFGLGIVFWFEWLFMERGRGEAVNDEGLSTRASALALICTESSSLDRRAKLSFQF